MPPAPRRADADGFSTDVAVTLCVTPLMSRGLRRFGEECGEIDSARLRVAFAGAPLGHFADARAILAETCLAFRADALIFGALHFAPAQPLREASRCATLQLISGRGRLSKMMIYDDA